MCRFESNLGSSLAEFIQPGQTELLLSLSFQLHVPAIVLETPMYTVHSPSNQMTGIQIQCNASVSCTSPGHNNHGYKAWDWVPPRSWRSGAVAGALRETRSLYILLSGLIGVHPPVRAAMLAERAGWHVEMVRKSHPSTHLNLCELRPDHRSLCFGN